jgi:zinc transporter ZupT
VTAWAYPFVASVAAAAVTTAGILTIRRFDAWSRRNTSYFMSFAAGVLVSASFLHIVPKAIALNSAAPAYLLEGFLALYLFNYSLVAFTCNMEVDDRYSFGLVPMLGIGFHSFVDGIVYSVTFTVGTFTGVMAAVGMVLHEFPEGIVTYVLLLRGGFRKPVALLLAFLAAALTTPLGMLVSYPVISRIGGPVLGILLSLSAGALVYVGATHLLPHAEHERRPFSLAALAAGVVVTVVIVQAH